MNYTNKTITENESLHARLNVLNKFISAMEKNLLAEIANPDGIVSPSDRACYISQINERKRVLHLININQKEIGR